MGAGGWGAPIWVTVHKTRIVVHVTEDETKHPLGVVDDPEVLAAAHKILTEEGENGLLSELYAHLHTDPKWGPIHQLMTVAMDMEPARLQRSCRHFPA